jgi:hypothetical protein
MQSFQHEFARYQKKGRERKSATAAGGRAAKAAIVKPEMAETGARKAGWPNQARRFDDESDREPIIDFGDPFAAAGQGVTFTVRSRGGSP